MVPRHSLRGRRAARRRHEAEGRLGTLAAMRHDDATPVVRTAAMIRTSARGRLSHVGVRQASFVSAWARIRAGSSPVRKKRIGRGAGMKRMLCGLALGAALFWTAPAWPPASAPGSTRWRSAMSSRRAAATWAGSISPDKVDYSENRKPRDIRAGILARPLRIDHSRSLLDTTQCATYTELVVTDPRAPLCDRHADALRRREAGQYGLGRHRQGRLGLQCQMDAPLRAEGRHGAHRPGRSATAARSSRRPPDAYLDRFGDNKIVVPWGAPCRRLEGGVSTGKDLPTDTCNLGMPDGGREGCSTGPM